jgi:predicted transcriptional regulator
MKTYISVATKGTSLERMALDCKAKDAQVMACALTIHALASRLHDGNGAVSMAEVGEMFNVSVFSVSRWLRRMAEVGIVHITDGGMGYLNVEFIGPVDKTKADNGNGVPGGEGQSKIASPLPPPPTPPTPRIREHQRGPDKVQQSKTIEKYGASVKMDHEVLGLTEQNRLDSVRCAVEQTTRIKLGDMDDVAKLLRSVVKNPMFNGLDLVAQVRDADAWLVTTRKKYTDMAKYLGNWLRRAAKAKRSNVNPLPQADKYDKFKAGRKIWP